MEEMNILLIILFLFKLVIITPHMSRHDLTNFKKEYPEDLIEVAIGVGNTFAYYIKDIMTSFIDDGLREEIKDEFTKINSPPMYSGLQYETSELYDWQRFSKAMQIMLTKNIEEITINPHDMENYTIKFRKNNQR